MNVNAAKTDFHIHPLTFKEYVGLVAPILLDSPEDKLDDLFDKFSLYLTCRGADGEVTEYRQYRCRYTYATLCRLNVRENEKKPAPRWLPQGAHTPITFY